MSFGLSYPETLSDADELIAAGMRAGLSLDAGEICVPAREDYFQAVLRSAPSNQVKKELTDHFEAIQ